MENLNYLKEFDDFIKHKCKAIEANLADKFDKDGELINEIRAFIKEMIMVKKSMIKIFTDKARTLDDEYMIISYIDEKFDEYFLNERQSMSNVSSNILQVKT
jgi:hypothetical protein